MIKISENNVKQRGLVYRMWDTWEEGQTVPSFHAPLAHPAPLPSLLHILSTPHPFMCKWAM